MHASPQSARAWREWPVRPSARQIGQNIAAIGVEPGEHFAQIMIRRDIADKEITLLEKLGEHFALGAPFCLLHIVHPNSPLCARHAQIISSRRNGEPWPKGASASPQTKQRCRMRARPSTMTTPPRIAGAGGSCDGAADGEEPRDLSSHHGPLPLGLRGFGGW